MTTRRNIIKTAVGALANYALLETSDACVDNIGSIVSDSGRYFVETACFTNAGWVAPVSPLSGTYLWTDKQFDYLSKRYLINNPEFMKGIAGRNHGGVDFVGSEHSSASRPNQQYTAETVVFSIGDGNVVGFVDKGGGIQGIYVEHKATDGTRFVALYLHVKWRLNLKVDKPVTAGEPLGTLVLYGNPMHLHFQIDTKLSRRSTGGFENGSTQDPLAFLIAHRGSGSELEPAQSKTRNYADYMRNSIHLGVFTNTNPDTGQVDDRAWRKANVPVTRGELIAIIRRFVEVYRPGYMNSLPNVDPPINLGTVFPGDVELRNLQAAGTVQSTHWDAVLTFVQKGLLSSTNSSFRFNDIATIGEAVLIFWKTVQFPSQPGLPAVTAFAGFRDKLQCADVSTPTAKEYLLPVVQSGATSNGYGRSTSLALVKKVSREWTTEKILTSNYFKATVSDETGYSLSATRAFLAKLGINLIKYLAEHGSNASTAIAAQPTSDPMCRFTSNP